MGDKKPQITIVGLGLIGGSIGLALRQSGAVATVIGHDKDPAASKQAKKIGAVDKTDWNLISACEESALIILAIPLSGIEATLKALGPYLQPGTVVVDTAALKAPVLAWADEILPEGVHFVGLDPIVGRTAPGTAGLQAARADLFQQRIFCLSPSPRADESVVRLATDLVGVLGGRPLFMDPLEHDGLLGAADQLPPLLALTLLDATVRQPVWREVRKVAGGAFESATQLYSDDPEVYSSLFLANRENIQRWIDEFMASLAAMRRALDEEDAAALADRFEALMEERNRWLLDRAQGSWDVDQSREMPPKPNLFVDTFLGGLWRKRPEKSEKDKRG